MSLKQNSDLFMCMITTVIKTIIKKFLNMIGYHQSDLSTDKAVYASGLCNWTVCVMCMLLSNKSDLCFTVIWFCVITCMVAIQIGLHSVLLPLPIAWDIFLIVALGFVTHFTFSSSFTHRFNFFCCRRAFFHRWLEIVDLIVVVVSFILTLTFSLLTLEEHGYAKWVFWIRQEPSCFSCEKEKIWWNWISKWSNHSKIICWM